MAKKIKVLVLIPIPQGRTSNMDIHEVDIIASDGGVATIRKSDGETYDYLIENYQGRLWDPHEDVWKWLGDNSKIYCTEVKSPVLSIPMIHQALRWMLIGKYVDIEYQYYHPGYEDSSKIINEYLFINKKKTKR